MCRKLRRNHEQTNGHCFLLVAITLANPNQLIGLYNNMSYAMKDPTP